MPQTDDAKKENKPPVPKLSRNQKVMKWVLLAFLSFHFSVCPPGSS